MFVRIPKEERRTFEQLEEHYLIEKRFAERLRNARKPERRSLYAELGTLPARTFAPTTNA